MTVYFFDVSDDGRPFKDSEGAEFADNELAATEALLVLFEVMRDNTSLAPDRRLTVTARTAAGRMTFKASLQLQTARLS